MGCPEEVQEQEEEGVRFMQAENERLKAQNLQHQAEAQGLRSTVEKLIEANAHMQRALGAERRRGDEEVASLEDALGQRDADLGSLRGDAGLLREKVASLEAALGERDAELGALIGRAEGWEVEKSDLMSLLDSQAKSFEREKVELVELLESQARRARSLEVEREAYREGALQLSGAIKGAYEVSYGLLG